jgi:hypothetical protein
MDFGQASRQTLRAFWSASFGSVTLFETLAGLLVPWCWPGARLQGCRFRPMPLNYEQCQPGGDPPQRGAVSDWLRSID